MKRIWKVYKYAAIAIFSLLLVDVIVVLFFSLYRPQIKQADAIIILGAAINTPALYNRSLQGLKLYKQSKAPIMILSGGRISSKYVSEAEYMRDAIYANSAGRPNVILEEDSHSTLENIINSKNKLPAAKSVIIVSDEFHLARAALIALRQGFYPVYWSAPVPGYYKRQELLFYYMREVFAMIAYLPKLVMN